MRKHLISIFVGLLHLQQQICNTIAQNLYPQNDFANNLEWLESSRDNLDRGIFERDAEIPRPNLRKQPRIVGGYEAKVGRYPYQVALLMEDQKTAFCGGTLITPTWVLSAAHCDGLGNRIQIGRHNFNDTAFLDYEEIAIKRTIPHPDFSLYTLENDITLIELEEPSSYEPVMLDSGSTVLTFLTEYTIMGWGTIASRGAQSNVLLEAQVDPVTTSKCNRRYIIYGGINPGIMMCAARIGVDSCQGDSGGPLMVLGANVEDDVQVGIVSWGIGCGTGIFPGVYTRVSSYREFVDTNVYGVSWSS